MLSDGDVRAAFGTLLRDIAKAIRDPRPGRGRRRRSAAPGGTAAAPTRRRGAGLTELLRPASRPTVAADRCAADRYRSGVAGTRLDEQGAREASATCSPEETVQRPNTPRPAAAGRGPPLTLPTPWSAAAECAARGPLGSCRPGLIGTIRSCQLPPRCAANVLANFLGRSCE
jgi:hypothetical protein